jgi:lipopolysaccharide export system permease protein
MADVQERRVARPSAVGDDSHVPRRDRGAAAREQRAAREQDRMNQYLVELHKKFAIPFACIIFVLIGAPLAVRFPRGGVGMVIAASLTIFGIYYVRR